MARILVIDDDNGFRSLLQTALERDGHQVWSATGGKEGIRVFQSVPVDLVITDIFMQEGEGLETIHNLRATCRDLPIIAVSGGGNLCRGNYLNVAKKIGAYRTFSKPLSLESLCACVQTALLPRPASNELA